MHFMMYINPSAISRATLGRLPTYLKHLESLEKKSTRTISATTIAKQLGYGEIQVRKDLNAVCGTGRPRVGYLISDLIDSLRAILFPKEIRRAVVVGAGRLGKALLEYEGFAGYGLSVCAAFDIDPSKTDTSNENKPILHTDAMRDFMKENRVRIGIITVPEFAAQKVCDELISCGVEAIWNFAPCCLSVPDDVPLLQENLALSLAHLSLSLESSEF